jgi:hypothetical protein
MVQLKAPTLPHAAREPAARAGSPGPRDRATYRARLTRIFCVRAGQGRAVEGHRTGAWTGAGAAGSSFPPAAAASDAVLGRPDCGRARAPPGRRGGLAQRRQVLEPVEPAFDRWVTALAMPSATKPFEAARGFFGAMPSPPPTEVAEVSGAAARTLIPAAARQSRRLPATACRAVNRWRSSVAKSAIPCSGSRPVKRCVTPLAGKTIDWRAGCRRSAHPEMSDPPLARPRCVGAQCPGAR